jgi:hypothetical protein
MTKNSKRCPAYTNAIFYSASQALSASCDVLYSVRREKWSAMEIAASAATAGLIEFFESYAFQGQSIINSETDDEISKSETPRPCLSAMAQFIYFILNMATTFANRYFLLVATQDLYEIELSDTYFWSILATDLLIKQAFAMSNEVYEAYEIIAKKTGYDKPFYASMYCPASGKRAREIFSLIGSLEHVIVDDLLGLALLLPKKAINYIAEQLLLKIALAIISILMSIPLIMQAYLFEGGHTREHLAQLIGEEDTFNDNIKLTPCRARLLKGATNMMAPLHGIASAVSVYFALWSDNPIASIALACMVFAGVGYGVYSSEVREAKESLDEMARNDEFVPLIPEEPINSTVEELHQICCSH